MVTETEHPLNDRNNNNVSSCPSRTSLMKHAVVDDGGDKEDGEDIKIHDDDNSKDIDDNTDDENIDVGVEESDMEDQIVSDADSSNGGSESFPRDDTLNRVRRTEFKTFTTNTPSRLLNGLARDLSSGLSSGLSRDLSSGLSSGLSRDLSSGLSSGLSRDLSSGLSSTLSSGLPSALSSGLSGCVVPIPSHLPPHLHPSPPHPPQTLLQVFHQKSANDRSHSNSPELKTITNNNNNNNYIKNNVNDCNVDSQNVRNNSPSAISSPKTSFISKLSFGIDRILNETKSKPQPRLMHDKRTPSRGEFESTESVHSDEDRDDDRTYPLPLPHPASRLPHPVASSSLASPPTATVVTTSRLPPRMPLSVDMVSPLSPFHGAVLPRDICRVDPPPSLDILPVRPAWPDVYVCPWTGVQRDRFGLVRRVGHPYQNRTPPKRKKPRTAFSRQQVLELEKRFTRQKYLASAERSALAKTLTMTDAQVKTWFQNRRTKWRRQTAEEREIERQAAHKFLLSLRPDDPNRPNIAAYGALCGVNQQGPQPAPEAPTSPGASSVN